MIITKKYLQTYSPLPKNYDVANLLPYVDVATKLWIKPIIGEDFYQELEEQVNAPSGGTLTPENATLLVDGGLWQYLAFATLHEALPFIWTRITEAGIQLGKSENSDSIGIKDLTVIQQHLRNQVEVLKEQLIEFICNHADNYPLIYSCQCECNRCCNPSTLTNPNPQRIIYGTPRQCTNIR